MCKSTMLVLLGSGEPLRGSLLGHARVIGGSPLLSLFSPGYKVNGFTLSPAPTVTCFFPIGPEQWDQPIMG
jgi:hypothetical protein